MKDVQCYELFVGIALKNHAFSLSCLESCFQSCTLSFQLNMQHKWLVWMNTVLISKSTRFLLTNSSVCEECEMCLLSHFLEMKEQICVMVGGRRTEWHRRVWHPY